MTGSTYLEYDKASSTGLRLIQTGENPTFGLLIVCGINLGLRIGDLSKLTYTQLKQDTFKIVEQKTGKERTLQVNNAIKLALMSFTEEMRYKLGGSCFVSQKGTIYSSQHVNLLIKKYFKGDNISSHSLRKAFGRRVWENNGETEKALEYLRIIFNHSNISTTRKYLGIRDEEIANIYLNL